MGKATYGTKSVGLNGKKWYGYPPRLRSKDPTTDQELASRRPVVLGPKSKLTKSEAREVLARENAKPRGWFRTYGQVMNDGAASFDRLCRNHCFPHKEGDWKEETTRTKKGLNRTNISG